MVTTSSTFGSPATSASGAHRSNYSAASSSVGRFAREGCTLAGSPGIFG